MGLGESMMNWLRSVDKDQNLQGIGNLTSTSMSDRVRRWFRRQDLTPTLETGYYNDETGYYVQGPLGRAFYLTGNSLDANIIVTDTSVDSVSDAAHTLTCPAGHVYKVTTAVCKNSTRVATWTLDFTPNGGTAMQVVDTGTGGTIQGESCPVIGTGGNDAAVDGIIGPVWLQAGDVLTITNTNFVAADVVEKAFIFEDYTL